VKKLLTIIILLAIVAMAGCVTAQEKPVTMQPEAPILTKADVANILNIAITDIEKQGCTAEFNWQNPALIWCRCKDKDGKQTIKAYDLEPLIKQYIEKREAKRNDTINRQQRPEADRGRQPETSVKVPEKNK